MRARCVADEGGKGGMRMQLHRPHRHVATFTWMPVDTYNGSARIVDSYCFVIGPADARPAGTQCWISLYWKFPAPHFSRFPARKYNGRAVTRAISPLPPSTRPLPRSLASLSFFSNPILSIRPMPDVLLISFERGGRQGEEEGWWWWWFRGA